MTDTAVQDAIDGLREGFQADGADLELQGVDDGVVKVRLVGTEETCWECIVPPPALKAMLEAAVGGATVQVEDPRDG